MTQRKRRSRGSRIASPSLIVGGGQSASLLNRWLWCNINRGSPESGPPLKSWGERIVHPSKIAELVYIQFEQQTHIELIINIRIDVK